jgi:aspartyl protease family protein
MPFVPGKRAVDARGRLRSRTMLRVLRLSSFLVFVLCVQVATGDDDPRQTLRDLGMKVVGDTVVVADEAKVSKMLSEIPKFKKRLIDATKARDQAEQNVVQKDAMIKQCIQQRLTLNAQLANVQTVEQNNRLVGMISVLSDQINLLSDSEKLEESVKESRVKANEIREAYVDHVMALRKAYDATLVRYEELALDEPLKETLAALSDDKPVKLGPSRSFVSSNEKIKKVEDTVLSETIMLRKESGVWFVSVVVNDAKPQEFVLDTGAGLLSIPAKVAEEMDLKVDSTSPLIRLSMADGRVITASQVFARKVRVGKFTVENVECAVLPPEAVAADPLLGQTFLGKFSFQFDGDKAN